MVAFESHDGFIISESRSDATNHVERRESKWFCAEPDLWRSKDVFAG